MISKYLQAVTFSALLWSPLSVLAQFNFSGRRCSSNETIPHVSNTTYETLNATGSVESPGINIGQNRSPTSWTWFTGVQLLFNSSRVFQPIWVDTKGTDLAAPDLNYEMCYMTMTGYTSAIQRRGQGDPGDCSIFLSRACVEDWKKAMTSQAGSFKSNLSAQTPCSELADFTPESCKEFGAGLRATSRVPTGARNCSLGQGDPDDDLLAVLIERNDDDKDVVDPANFKVYDTVATRIVPFFFLAWTTSEDSQVSADARVICLNSRNVTEGSRKPQGVPSAARKEIISSYFWITIGFFATIWFTCNIA